LISYRSGILYFAASISNSTTLQRYSTICTIHPSDTLNTYDLQTSHNSHGTLQIVHVLHKDDDMSIYLSTPTDFTGTLYISWSPGIVQTWIVASDLQQHPRVSLTPIQQIISLLFFRSPTAFPLLLPSPPLLTPLLIPSSNTTG